jgi:hypothetical protein
MTFTETLKTEYVFLVPTVETIISALNHKQEIETLFKSDFVSQQDLQNGIEGYDIQRVQAFAIKSFFRNIDVALTHYFSSIMKLLFSFDESMRLELTKEKEYCNQRIKQIKHLINSGEMAKFITLEIFKDNTQFAEI